MKEILQQLQSLLQKTSDIKNINGNPQEQIRVLKSLGMAQVFEIYLVKKNRKNPAALEGGCKAYGKRSRLAGQPRIGPHWQAQYQSMQTV